MKKIILILIYLTSSITLAHSTEVDSLLKVLDATIEARPIFSKNKELKIDSLKMQLGWTKDGREQYKIYSKLYREYRSYNMDSALQIAYKQNEIATELKSERRIYTSKMKIAEMLSRMGMYKESLDIIEDFDIRKLDKGHRSFYYHLYHSTYVLLYENSQTERLKQYYKEQIAIYKDSLLTIHPEGSLTHDLNLNGKYIDEGEYQKAFTLIQKRYTEFKDDQDMLGSIAYGMATVYKGMSNREEEKKYLAISAIADIRKAQKTYISLRELAIILYDEGDIERAYRYIKCTMEDANFSKARFRALESSQMLPIITAAYEKKAMQEKDNLFKYLILISILSVILLVSIIYIYSQYKKLSQARAYMKYMNTNLTQMNQGLTDLNKKLSESNHVKEEYIGSIFNLCSSYIDKLEDYRINLNRKLVSKKFDEAIKITGSGSLVNDELKEFFRNFDAIFLNIYPNFVDEFNALLLEEEAIIPKTGDILTSELRVFALVRLGISDSSKIAAFLHYSPQTVYNYNLKIKNKLAVSKDEFAIAIQNIGL